MFITLTIDTNIKKKKNSMRIKRQSINVAKGWRMAIHSKKRSFMQKMKDWKTSARKSSYQLGDQGNLHKSNHILSLSENFDPQVQARTLRSKFSCRLVSDRFPESSQAVMFQ